jgi:hypothetical protein
MPLTVLKQRVVKKPEEGFNTEEFKVQGWIYG